MSALWLRAREERNFCGLSAYLLCRRRENDKMAAFLLWLILFIVCWPLALLALLLYPIVWLILLPFRLLGIVVGGVFAFLWALVTLPARLLGGPSRA